VWGICGVLFSDASRRMDPETLRSMRRSIRHLGPDSRGTFIAPGIAPGVQRLSIVDARTGDQPIDNEAGSIVTVCNREIYNFVELRKGLKRRGHRFRSRGTRPRPFLGGPRSFPRSRARGAVLPGRVFS